MDLQGYEGSSATGQKRSPSCDMSTFGDMGTLKMRNDPDSLTPLVGYDLATRRSQWWYPRSKSHWQCWTRLLTIGVNARRRRGKGIAWVQVRSKTRGIRWRTRRSANLNCGKRHVGQASAAAAAGAMMDHPTTRGQTTWKRNRPITDGNPTLAEFCRKNVPGFLS